MLAAWNAFQAAARLLKNGNINYSVTDIYEQVAQAYNVNVVEGCLSHIQKRHILDGNSSIIAKETIEQRVQEIEF